MPSLEKFERATPETSGVVQSHLRHIHRVCEMLNTFVFIRPSTVPTMRLIRAGFATKSMDIHDKSSDWGLTSGFVPVDQAFSKKQSNAPKPDIHPHGHGAAQAVHLKFSTSQFAELWGAQHFELTTEVLAPQPPCHQSPDHRHFHSTKNSDVCFLLKKNTGQVYWTYRVKQPRKPVEMWVWGYNGVPVTGDYDLWMVAPHISNVRGDNNVGSVKDKHGRSAATQFTTELMGHLNRECGRSDKPVFNHGAEAQNYSFTQALDKRLVVFAPGPMYPFMITRIVLPGLLHDLLRHGYVVVRNPKWLKGHTLGIEDMADAADLFPDDGAVQAGVKALQTVEQAAAKTVQRALLHNVNRANSGGASQPLPESDPKWHERYGELKPFRALGDMPSNQGKDLVLPPDAFPTSVWYEKNKSTNRFAELALLDEAREGREATRFAQNQEARFGRQKFAKEDGHVVPVDATRKKR